MITVNYTKEKEYKAHYKDSSGFLVKFGPYPTKKCMEASIFEYMKAIKVSMYKLNNTTIIKKE
jgi:hypothetical protein